MRFDQGLIASRVETLSPGGTGEHVPDDPTDDLSADLQSDDTEPPTAAFTRELTIEDRRVIVATRTVHDRFATRVEDATNGALLGRARGATREEAEENAIENASVKLGLAVARTTLRRGLEHLPSEAARASDKIDS